MYKNVISTIRPVSLKNDGRPGRRAILLNGIFKLFFSLKDIIF